MRGSFHLAGLALILALVALAGIKYASAPTVLASGRFHPVAHKGSGTGILFRLRDGKRIVRIRCLQTGNRPDLAVYLIAAEDAFDNETVMNSRPVLLGTLKGTARAQDFVVPAAVNLNQYHAVTVWSEKYQVNFTTAPLH